MAVFLGYNQYWPVGYVFFVVICPGGSTGSGSSFKASQKTGPRLNVSIDRLGETRIELGTPGYKASDLSTTPRRLTKHESVEKYLHFLYYTMKM